eukprot:2200299-Amphidinium_carterae.1
MTPSSHSPLDIQVAALNSVPAVRKESCFEYTVGGVAVMSGLNTNTFVDLIHNAITSHKSRQGDRLLLTAQEMQSVGVHRCK